MNQFQAQHLVNAVSRIEMRIGQYDQAERTNDPAMGVQYEYMFDDLIFAHRFFKESGLVNEAIGINLSVAQLRAMVKPTDYVAIKVALRNIYQQMLIGVNRYVFLRLEPGVIGSAIDNEQLFGVGVYDAFESARADIKEGGNCLVVGFHTAAVFHFMRAVEHGLRALVTALGVPVRSVPFSYEEWNTLIERADTTWKIPVEAWGHSAERTNARQFFKRIIADLNAFKDDVRNIVMHTRDSYDAAGALSVENRVGAWFKLLAAKVSDDGAPGSVLDRTLFLP
jgi:hypothetical protein